MSLIGQYFEKRKKIYTQSIKGRFRKKKSLLNILFLSIYLFSPFIRFDRAGSAADQGILIDMINGKAYFFFIEIWPEEAYYLAGILVFAAVLLFFITSLFGRIWCGYACFQTVWSDVFAGVEKFFQGDRNQRILLDRKKYSLEKFLRKAATHISWLLIGLITGFGFICYFNDAPSLVKNLFELNLTYTQIGWIFGIAFATYIMAGFAREQVCIYMCPYAKFQSAMFDKDTLIITYDEKRGEPRQKAKKGDNFSNRGHCIDCKQCVVVCPTGIDIRNGLQIECIACGLCIDACDNVMEKMDLPKGLIRYDTANNMQNIDLGKNTKFRILRPRTFYYCTIILVIASFMIFNLANKATVKIDVLADRNPMFVKLSDGSIRNGYDVKIFNKTHEAKTFTLKIIRPQEAELKIQSMMSDVSIDNLPVKADSDENFKIYVTLTKNISTTLGKSENLELIITDKLTGKEQVVNTVFTNGERN